MSFLDKQLQNTKYKQNSLPEVFSEKPVLKISQNSRENTCVNLKPVTLLKKRLWPSCFHANFATFLKTSFMQKTSSRCLW